MSLMSYFEEKLVRLNKKHIHFQSCLTDREHNTADPIGTYSGKFLGNQAAKADYADQKIKIWDIIFNFVDQYPPTKISTNPIIQRAIEAEAQRRVDAFGKLTIINPSHVSQLRTYNNETRYFVSEINKLPAPAKPEIDKIASQHPVRKLNDMIDNSYDLKTYSEAHLKKWRTRIGGTQKINILAERLKSLNSPSNGLEGGANNSPAIGWQSSFSMSIQPD